MKTDISFKLLFLTIGLKIQILDLDTNDGDVKLGFQLRLAWK